MPTKKKPVKKVTRKFLLDLANKVYDPKTKRFLRLCDGSLQNGPDPTNPRRPMHCGLGELYFAMTGRQPETDTNIDEEGVIDLAVERSTLKNKASKDAVSDACDAIHELDIPDPIKEHLIDSLRNVDDNDFMSEEEEQFRIILDGIPGENDDGCGHDEKCSVTDFRARSKRVAAAFRQAAKLLPA